MPVSWKYPYHLLQLGGRGDRRISPEDAARQEATVQAVLDDFRDQPGVVLADEVGMGKTYVALGVISSVLVEVRGEGRPVVVMVPPGLVSKWSREWNQFKLRCCKDPEAFDWVLDRTARTAAEFFQLLDDTPAKRPHIIWMPTSGFSAGLDDPWIKLAFVRLARSRTKLTSTMKARIVRWAPDLVRVKSIANDQELMRRLLDVDVSEWRDHLVNAGVLSPGADDPVPRHLVRHAGQLNWVEFIDFLRLDRLPGSRGAVSAEQVHAARLEFARLCKGLYQDWLRVVKWRAPLVVLDEAHHAKNDSTRLATLFRSDEFAKLVASENSPDHPILWGKFDRQLFLTATPFQLGHQELVRVLRSFASASWDGPSAPRKSRQTFWAAMNELQTRLDDNRLAGRHLDGAWGRLTRDRLPQGMDEPAAVAAWWAGLAGSTADQVEREVREAVERYKVTKAKAELDTTEPWNGLRRWVIRHNRPRTLPRHPDVARRLTRAGRSIASEAPAATAAVDGLSIGVDPLPFLLAARAQGELALSSGKARAWFADGLCSSYEAFHHTHDLRGEDARDLDDDGREREGSRRRGTRPRFAALQWYEDQVEKLVPSRTASADERLRHPKIQPVVQRAVDLWLKGEKVLVFCFYRETARALREHLRREVERTAAKLVAGRLGLSKRKGEAEARRWLERVASRFRRVDSPFHMALRSELQRPFRDPKFRRLGRNVALKEDLVGHLLAYVCAPTFLARYLPLEDEKVRMALREGESRRDVIQAGVRALQEALSTRADGSGTTMTSRVRSFLDFVLELEERRKPAAHDDEDEARDPLAQYLDAIDAYTSPKRSKDDDDDDAKRRTSYRALPTVRLVYGATRRDVRERLMLAFNSPLFPEILVSSSVLAEGVDLHRFCRHVIHHDLCWNPSTLEQRTGRLDRIRCKAEETGHPIVIYEPFIGGSADEKMYRVVRDRERWFQVVMGQKFEFDEAASEKFASRIPLPEGLAAELLFDLRRAKHSPLGRSLKRPPKRNRAKVNG